MAIRVSSKRQRNLIEEAFTAGGGQIPYAHRGAGGFVGRDNMLSAMEYQAATGKPCIIDGGDWNRLADGTFVCNHDDTTGRTLTGIADTAVASLTPEMWKKLQYNSGNAYMTGPTDNFFGWLPSFQGEAIERPPFAADVLQRLGRVAAIGPEIKAVSGQNYAQTVLDAVKLIRRYGVERSIELGCSGSTTDTVGGLTAIQIARRAGIAQVVIGSNTQADLTTATIIASGANCFSPQFRGQTWTDAYLQAIADAGMRIEPWYTDRRSVGDGWRARPGVTHVVTNDPQYLYRQNTPYTTDQFVRGVYMPGMLPRDNFTRAWPDPTNTGKMVFDAQGSGQTMLLGHMVNEAAGAPTTWSWSVTLDAAGSDATRFHYAILWCPDDSSAGLATTGSTATGYVIGFTPSSGAMWIQRSTGATQTNIGPNGTASGLATTTAQTAGQTIPFTATLIAGNAIRVTRTDTGATFDSNADTTYRGAYAHVGKSTPSAGTSGKMNISVSAVTRTP